jgi:hypothetical protein
MVSVNGVYGVRESKLVKRVSVLMVVLLVVSFLLSVGLICPAHGASLVTISGQYDKVWITPTTFTYCVQNNVYNPGSGWEQELQVNNQTGAFSVIESNANNSTNIVSYPFINRGNHWGTATINSGLPMQVSGLNVSTSWNISTINSGHWAAAYTLWFHKTSDYTDGQPNGAGLMIDLSHIGPVSEGGKVSTVSLAGANWDVYYQVMASGSLSWNQITYLRTSNTTFASFNLTTFVADAVSRGYIQNSWYLVSVEAGFYIWQGGVGLTSNSFSVTAVAPVQTKAGGPLVWWPLITIAAVVIVIAIAIAVVYVLRRKKQT